MAPSTRPGNAHRQFGQYDQDPREDDNFPPPPQHQPQQAFNLGYQLDQIPQAGQAADLARQDFEMDSGLEEGGDYPVEGDLNEADLTFASTATASTSQHPVPDSAYGGSPYPTGAVSHTYGTSRGGKNKGPKNFVCSYGPCRKAFARKSDLVRHQRIHTNERQALKLSFAWPTRLS